MACEIDGKARTLDVLLDTGAPNGLEFSRKAAAREGLDDLYGSTKIEPAPGGVGGSVRVRRIGPVRLRVGDLELAPEATVSMTEGGASGAKAEYDALMGDAALRRFDVIFDYWRGRVYLRSLSPPGERGRGEGE